MNITASVFINDDEHGLHRDYEKWLEKLAPGKPYFQYQHNGFEDNADARRKNRKRDKRVPIKIIGEQFKTFVFVFLVMLSAIIGYGYSEHFFSKDYVNSGFFSLSLSIGSVLSEHFVSRMYKAYKPFWIPAMLAYGSP